MILAMATCVRMDELVDYDMGAQDRLDGVPFDPTAGPSWKVGWRELDEDLATDPSLNGPIN
jgi:hypothetical protein